MSKRVRTKMRRRSVRRSPWIILLLLLAWSICLGWGIAIALGTPEKSLALGVPVPPDLVAQATPEETGTVDPVTPRYQLGKELYLENCASCHVGLPPEILPSETWRRLLLEPEQHYGQHLKPMIGPSLRLIWDYLQTYSRPEEAKRPTPYRISESRYFKALHPRIKLPQPLNPGSCVTCHPGASQYNYRRLTPEWENSP